MLLKNKTAVIFGAGGSVGGAVALAFAREGARLFLTGRSLRSVDETAKKVRATSQSVETAEVDALDEQGVERHAASVADRAGGIDVAFNAIGFDAVQGKPLVDLALTDFNFPISTWTSAQFLTARAAARHMVPKRSGVILTLSASPARLAIPLTGGFGVACAAIEGLSRTLAAELSPHGVRVICLRPHRIADTFAEPDFPDMKKGEFRSFLEGMTLLNRLPTLTEVANTAAFLASDHAASITGTVANLTCGMSVD